MSPKTTVRAGKSGSKAQRDAATFLSQQAREHDVKFIRIWFTDILGFLKSFAITIDSLEKALEEGVGVDGSSIESFARAEEHDMIAVCDPKTFQVLPWRPKENAVARMFADIHHMDGRPFDGDPRHCLKRQLKRAAQLGYTFYVGPEIEFFYFKSSERPEPADQGGYFDLAPLDTGSDMRRQTVLTLEELGIPVHSSHHEVAPGQHEIDLKHMDALTMADSVMTYRLTAKEIAQQHGVHATFMPKPIEGQDGSGMHVHQSLFHASSKGGGERNAFYDPRDKHQMSPIAKHYVAGLLRHAREMAIVTNQWVNSYKRLVTGYEAPTHILWGQKNRSALVRIPMNKAGRPENARAEFRSPDPACNPYLAFSVMLAAGLQGIQKKYPLPKSAEGDVVSWSREEKAMAGVEELPTSLGEAIEVAKKSKFLRDTLGPQIFHSLIENKEIEWEKYRHHISQLELKTGLSTL